jgi:Fic family protein
LTPSSAEIAYLKRLIKDFPAEVKPEKAKRAHQKIASRYFALEQVYQRLAHKYWSSSISRAEIPVRLKQLAHDIHGFLFYGILSNAGQVRKKIDLEDGRIEFGGTRHQQQRSEFVGTAPAQIDSELDEAFSHLIQNPDDPIEQAMRFYQHFVYIHPFYDANGRIGRIIVSIYLFLFDYYVQWEEFDGPNNSKFINKLNACHKRLDSGYTFDQYFGYLLSFFRNYVISVDELSDFR